MQVELQYADDLEQRPISQHDCARWVLIALKTLNPLGLKAGDVCVRICGEAESHRLNATYRHKDAPTNVLSFAGEVEGKIFGDLALCLPVMEQEAAEQHKSLHDHAAHLIVHGVLHLMGFDHVSDAEAEEMETLEIRVLDVLGISNPYL